MEKWQYKCIREWMSINDDLIAAGYKREYKKNVAKNEPLDIKSIWAQRRYFVNHRNGNNAILEMTENRSLLRLWINGFLKKEKIFDVSI